MKYRGTLIDLFRFAKMKGWYPADRDNPAEITYSKTDYGEDRQRLTLDQFKAIHEIADNWMQVAMELALVALVGRYEVCNMKYSDERDGKLHWVCEKSKKLTGVMFGPGNPVVGKDHPKES